MAVFSLKSTQRPTVGYTTTPGVHLRFESDTTNTDVWLLDRAGRFLF